jgi:hypothetical protein
MNHSLETVPTTWTDADEQFFAVVKRLLPADFLLWGTVLLAGYDDETVTPATVSTPQTSVASTPAPGVQALPR